MPYDMTVERWNALTRAEQDAWRTEHKTWPCDVPGNLLAKYNDGRATRVEVAYNDGRVERGYIGRTTGWAPAWLLLARRTSNGSSNLLDAATIKSIRPVSR